MVRPLTRHLYAAAVAATVSTTFVAATSDFHNHHNNYHNYQYNQQSHQPYLYSEFRASSSSSSSSLSETDENGSSTTHNDANANTNANSTEAMDGPPFVSSMTTMMSTGSSFHVSSHVRSDTETEDDEDGCFVSTQAILSHRGGEARSSSSGGGGGGGGRDLDTLDSPTAAAAGTFDLALSSSESIFYRDYDTNYTNDDVEDVEEDDEDDDQDDGHSSMLSNASLRRSTSRVAISTGGGGGGGYSRSYNKRSSRTSWPSDDSSHATFLKQESRLGSFRRDTPTTAFGRWRHHHHHHVDMSSTLLDLRGGAAAATAAAATAAAGTSTELAKNLINSAIVTLVFEACMGHILEFLKIAMQTSPKGTTYAKVYKEITNEKGLAGLWDGFIPWGVIQSVMKGGVFGLAYAVAVKYLKPLADEGALPMKLAMTLAGGIAGGFQGFVLSPTLLMKTRVMTNEVFRENMSILQTTWKSLVIGGDIIKKEGIGSLMKGANTFAVKRVFDWSTRYYFADLFETIFVSLKGSSLTLTEKSVASLLGGIASTVLTLPLDVLVAKTQDAKKAGVKVSAWMLFSEELKQEGWTGLRNNYMSGFEARLAHVCLTTVVMKTIAPLVYDRLFE